jgi:pimeloyl-ACP methyl ester carboxylesterase
MPTIESPFYPIIYVRGYAGNDTEIEDTVADPYMGFNLGSTKFRQLWDGRVRRHYFESPIVRLAKDYGYTDVYSGGDEMPLDCEIGPRSVFIYRYYDEQFFDALLGRQNGSAEVSGEARKIEEFAEGLDHLIGRVRDRICGADQEAKAAFKVYLVGHSMGGLVCRCFLQHPRFAESESLRLVDKVFTYATPHNGIEFKVLGNVPGFFSMNDVNNFNRQRMADYLGVTDATDVANLAGRFDAERFFCLVGTNWQDYAAGAGWSRRLTGPMSDGLVRIVNATVYSQVSAEADRVQCPRAFIHRSHSGHFGIVNSEEGYQNLVRFLFGDLRVDGTLELDEITLPPAVAKAREEGRQIRASYHFEVVVRVRGFDWELHRRTVRDESAIFRTFDEMFPKDGSQPRPPHLFSVFLSSGARVKPTRRSLGFAIDLAVTVPEYEVDGRWWRDNYYAGSYLFRDTITIEATPGNGGADFKVRYGLDSKTPNRVTRTAEIEEQDGGFACRIPIASDTAPGLEGTLVLGCRRWGETS